MGESAPTAKIYSRDLVCDHPTGVRYRWFGAPADLTAGAVAAWLASREYTSPPYPLDDPATTIELEARDIDGKLVATTVLKAAATEKKKQPTAFHVLVVDQTAPAGAPTPLADALRARAEEYRRRASKLDALAKIAAHLEPGSYELDAFRALWEGELA